MGLPRLSSQQSFATSALPGKGMKKKKKKNINRTLVCAETIIMYTLIWDCIIEKRYYLCIEFLEYLSYNH